WFLEIRPGIEEATYPGTMEHQRQQEDDWPARDAANFTVGQPNFGNVDTLEGTGNLVVVVPPPIPLSSRLPGVSGALHSMLDRQVGGSGLPLSAGAGAGPVALGLAPDDTQGERKADLDEALPDR